MPDIESRIDAGALRAITRKESGGRLLPAGVVRVEGVFASHQAVRLVVRRRRKIVERTLKSASSARSSSNETSPDPSSPSLAGAQILHPIPRNRPIDLLSGAMTDIIIQPDTPNLKPVMSLSSSIASLDPLSRSVPPSPALHAITERLAANNICASPLAQELKTVPEAQVLRDRGEADGDEWEEAEIGKGLAQYNSVEIDRIKGMKR
jgi:glutamate 5-kinase